MIQFVLLKDPELSAVLKTHLCTFKKSSYSSEVWRFAKCVNAQSMQKDTTVFTGMCSDCVLSEQEMFF